MAVALFSGNNLQVITDGPEVDLKIGEYHAFSATPTTYTIESGAAAADHIIENPDGLEVNWVMSNLDDNGQSYGNRAAALLDGLRALIKQRGLYEVVTRHRIYPSMAIIGVSAEHIGPFTGSLRGRVIFQEVNRTLLERTMIPESKPKKGVKKTASTQTNAGRVEGKTPTSADKQAAGRGTGNPSVLSQIFKR